MTQNVRQVERDVQGLGDELKAVQARTAEYESALEDLGRQHDEAAARLELSQRQAAEFAARLEVRKAELEEARQQQAAYEAFRAAESGRDAAGLEVVAAINVALDKFAELDHLHHAVAAAREAVSPGYDVTAARESEELVDAWQKLVEFVRSRIDEQLQDEVVEAAARSSMGFDIQALPQHLRAVARARRRQLLAGESRSATREKRLPASKVSRDSARDASTSTDS